MQIEIRRVITQSSNMPNKHIYVWLPGRTDENLGDLGMSTVIDNYFTDENVVFISNNGSIDSFQTKHKKIYFDQAKNKHALIDIMSGFPVERFIVVGADTVDGAYTLQDSFFKLITSRTFQKMNIASSIINLSWSGKKVNFILKKMLVSASSSGAKIVTRDVVSFRRIKDLGIDPILSADLVFGLEHNGIPEQSQTFSNSQKSGLPMVVIGFGVPLNGEIEYFSKMLNLCRYLLDSSFRIVLLPSNTSTADTELNMRLISELNSGDAQLYKKSSSSREFLDHLALATFGISNRMHFVIHAAIAGVPVIGVEYQGKFEGLFEMLGMQDFLVPELGGVKDLILELQKELVSRKSQISESLPVLAERSLLNLL